MFFVWYYVEEVEKGLNGLGSLPLGMFRERKATEFTYGSRNATEVEVQHCRNFRLPASKRKSLVAMKVQH